MIKTIYSRAISVLMKKPIRLWGLSLLSGLLAAIGNALFGIIPGIGLAIAWLLSVSMTMVFLHGYRGEDVSTKQLFDAFKDWKTIKRVCLGMGWMVLWIFIWGLIPIVGFVFAFIRAYEYRLTPYILVTEPDVSIMDAIKVSKQRTNGYKKSMFLADLLPFASLLAATLVFALFEMIPVIRGLFFFVEILVYICFFALLPLFRGIVNAAYYEEISNPTIPLEPELPTYAAPGYYASVQPAAPVTEPAPQPVPEAPAPAAEPAAVFCPSCGEKLPAGTQFCPSCGEKL